MKLRYYDRAKKLINGRCANDCLSFNWEDRIKDTCKVSGDIQGKCCMLDGKECPIFEGGK